MVHPMTPSYESPADIRVLIVEDDPDTATTLAKLLHGRGMMTRVASTAIEALRAPSRESFAMARIDVSLGSELDGVDVAEWLTRLYSIPVVFASAVTDEDVLVRARSVRPAGYLVKPIEPAQLFSAVTMAIGTSVSA